MSISVEHIIWNMNPELISLGPITIHYYGVLFAAAIFSGLYYMRWIFTLENQPVASLDNLLIYAVIGIIVGARLGHCFFYEPAYYLSNPIEILMINKGGLASHGGGLGVILAVWLYSKRHQLDLMWLLDRLAIATALFGIFVRSANFINSEIVGKPSDVPWAIVFQRIDSIARHPAQLYEVLAYLFIFVILTITYKNTSIKNRKGMLLGLFLIMTFTARFIIEFFKERQAAYDMAIVLNTGQLLSIPFFIVGLGLIFWALKSSNTESK